MISISKYGAKKITVDGIRFDSKMEADFYLELKKQKQDGLIVDFELQPRFELIPKFEKNGIKYRKMEYVADFLVFIFDDKGTVIKQVVDVKGFSRDSTFLLKQKLFNWRYRDLTLVLITWYGGKWITIEEKAKLIKAKKQKTLSK